MTTQAGERVGRALWRVLLIGRERLENKECGDDADRDDEDRDEEDRDEEDRDDEDRDEEDRDDA